MFKFGVGLGPAHRTRVFSAELLPGDPAVPHASAVREPWTVGPGKAPRHEAAQGLMGKERGEPRAPPGSLLAPGLLERPVLPPPVAIDTASYKIFVSGKSGVGKTALVAKLAGLEVPIVHHETTADPGLPRHPDHCGILAC